MAKHHYTRIDDGLSKKWFGRVWLNPPFGREAVMWLRRMAEHRNGIALIPARTETQMFYECVWGTAVAVLFVKGRPHFYYPNGKRAPFNSGAPICLIAYSVADAEILDKSGLGCAVCLEPPLSPGKRAVLNAAYEKLDEMEKQ
jgi:hypothetical protein